MRVGSLRSYGGTKAYTHMGHTCDKIVSRGLSHFALTLGYECIRIWDRTATTKNDELR